MARWLKQSTSVDVPIGPFLDSTDGVTPETGLTLTQPDIRLKKNGAAWAQKNAAQTLSHEENGFYEVTLDATDTNTLGLMRLAVFESGAAPVWEDFLVVPANVYDSYFSTDLLQVDATQWLGGAIATPTVTGVPEVDVTHYGGSAGTFASGRPEVNASHIAGGATSATILNRLYGSAAVTGTADSGTTTTMVDAARTEADTDYWADSWIIFASGTIAGQCRRITAFDPATDTITFDPATTQAVGTQNYVIVPSSKVSADLYSVGGTLQTPIDIGAQIGDFIGVLGTDMAGFFYDASATDIAIAVWANGTRTLTANPGLDAAGVRSAVGLASANLDTQLTAIDDFLDTEVAAIKAKTDNLPTDPADASDIAALIGALPTAAENAAAVLTTAMTESYAADGAAPTLAQALYALVQYNQDRAISGTTMTVKKLDGTTAAITLTIDDATNPTSVERTA